MCSALPVQYRTDSSQWQRQRPLCTNWHVSALENFKSIVSSTEPLVIHMPRYFWAAAGMWKHFSFPLEGERLTLQKSFSVFFFFFLSYTTPPVSSAGPLWRDGPQGTSVPRFSMPHSSSTLLVMYHHWHSYTWTLWCCQTPGLIFHCPNEK